MQWPENFGDTETHSLVSRSDILVSQTATTVRAVWASA